MRFEYRNNLYKARARLRGNVHRDRYRNPVRWSPHEHAYWKYYVKCYGNNYAKIAELLQSKTADACRVHATFVRTHLTAGLRMPRYARKDAHDKELLAALYSNDLRRKSRKQKYVLKDE